MCGIAGFVAFKRLGPDAAEIGARMASAIAHRGPDDHGVWLDHDAGVVLCHRRLAVIDLTPAGHQPMLSAGGRLIIVFNGEIYNHSDIRRELAAAGLKLEWRGHSDTETLLAAIEAWGLQAALRRCIGMFSLALWDRHERRLSLARDRMGEKPLYYGTQDGNLIFGSELAALRACPLFDPRIDRDALSLYMNRGYVPAPASIYEGVQKLSAGTFLEIDAEPFFRTHQLPSARPYWSLPAITEPARVDGFTGNAEEAADRLESLLTTALADQMVADVPVGAFLSGGVDSSLVVALMQHQSSRPVRTFTIGFREPRYDEAPYARRIARHLGTEHMELYVTGHDALAVVPSLPAIYSEPFADISQIPTCLVARMTRSQVTVALSGDGGDELFGGYSRYFLCQSLWQRIAQVPRPARAALSRLIAAASPGFWTAAANSFRAVLPTRFRRPLLGDDLYKGRSFLKAHSAMELYLLLLSQSRRGQNIVLGSREDPWLTDLDSPGTEDFLAQAMLFDAATYLPDDILAKVDRAAMAVSLETRVPLLDHRVVEFAFSLPVPLRVRGGQGKQPLRHILARYVPQALFDRPKMGFGAPIDEWLRGPLREWAESLLDASLLRSDGLLDSRLVREKWNEHLSGRRNWQFALWNVLMFQAWRMHTALDLPPQPTTRRGVN